MSAEELTPVARSAQTAAMRVRTIIGGLCVALSAACGQTAIGRAPSTFVPAQTLHFEDAGGQKPGTLTLGTDGALTFVWDVAPEAVQMRITLSPKGRLAAILDARPTGRPRLVFDVNRRVELGLVDRAGRYQSFSGRRRRMTFSMGTARLLAERLARLVVSPAPGFSSSDAVPDQDRQFVDKEGRTFAVAGLSSAAEPSIGLLDRNRQLRAAVFLADKQWLTVKLLDTRGDVRVSIVFGPQDVPHATIWEHDNPDDPDQLSPYLLDAAAGQERASDGGGWLPWFRREVVGVRLPLQLIDQRGTVIWKE
jgi:hypothetical protein